MLSWISEFINVLVLNILLFLGVFVDYAPLVALLIKIILFVLVILLSVAYSVWLERKIHALVARREGPNVVGPFGLLQPLTDAFKLLLKETIIPSNADKYVFIIAPLVIFIISMLSWAVIPFEPGVVFADLNVGILYLLATSSLSIYGIIMAGWASNSKYAFLGAVRSSAQMISYELSMGIIVLCCIVLVGDLNLTNIIYYQESHVWNIIPLFPMAILFFIVMIAETNRHPFDLPEAEAELVSGYNVEYSGFIFALFFLAEYANSILMSAIFAILFLGGWLPLFDFGIFQYIPPFFWFVFKIVILLSLIIHLKSVLPRYRYDQLMRLGWKVFIPLSLSFFVILVCILRFV